MSREQIGATIDIWKKRVIDLAFPRRCPFCDKPVKPPGGLCCARCASIPVPVGEVFCVKCGKPVPDEEQYCEDCKNAEHDYSRGIAVFRYRSVADAIYRFKYLGRKEYADYFGVYMAERFEKALRDGTLEGLPDLLVPVPASRQRMRKRGYNQAALLAQAMNRSLPKELRVPMETEALQRVVNTAVMRTLGVEARKKNLKKAFHVYGNSVRLKSIMLIDDIYTTGTTIDACARALREAGAADVTFMSLAIGERM